MTTALTFIFALILVFVAISVTRTHIKAWKLSRMSWDELVSKIEPVSVGIVTIARDYLQPGKDQIQLKPHELWELSGGLDGLQKMYANAEILIALA
jgi:hypothetical protein